VISSAGYTTIEGIGQGSGLSMIGGTVGSIVIGTNGPGAYNVTPPARTAINIALRNFSITRAANLGVSTGMIISSCSQVIVENLNFLNASSSADDFMLTVGNASNVFVRGCSFVSTGTGHDGVHIDGLCEDILVSDCYFKTGDDCIALNAPEGYGGDISRVTVTNCIADSSGEAFLRIYTSLDPAAMASNNVHKVRNVVVSNCTGTVEGVCFNLGITNGGLSSTAGADQIQDLSVSNCTLSSPQGLLLLLAPVGLLTFSDVKFIPTTTAPLINCLFSSIGEVNLRGVRVLRNPDGNAAPSSIVYLYGGVALDRMTLSDFAVVDEEGSSYGAIPCIFEVGGTIAAARLEGIDMTHITALAAADGSLGNIALLRGGGVLGTGAQIPDATMDNNCLYLSSSAGGAPSIKVSGTAKRLTLA
jgi:hypothetical protein